MTIFSLRQLPETGITTRLKAGMKSALLAGMMVAGTIAPAAATDKITLLLDWFVNPDHGPIIIAEEKGVSQVRVPPLQSKPSERRLKVLGVCCNPRLNRRNVVTFS